MNNEIQDPDFSVLITAYRKSLIRRYSQQNIDRFPEVAKSIDRKVIDKIITYFLELLYPEYEVRKELDNAFHSLSGFVHSPLKFIGVIGNMAYAAFKFGKHLFSGIKAGASALSSYLTAHKFERTLFHYAKPMIHENIDISDEENFGKLIAKIPLDEATKFRHDIIRLFKTLADQELLDRIIQIMDHIIDKMKHKPNLYSISEIKGIEMGMQIIIKGKSLFAEFNQKEIETILHGIDLIEKDFFESLIIKPNKN